MWLVTILFSIFAGVTVIADTKNCKTCKLSVYHATGCAVSKTCGKSYAPIHMSKESQNLITKMHNLFRHRIAVGLESNPEASNMRYLHYYPDREELASCAANLCEDSKYYQDMYDANGERLGYNIFISNKHYDMVDDLATDATLNWIGSHSSCPKQAIYSFKKDVSSDCSSRIQTLWATTNKISCAGMRYDQNISMNFRYLKIYKSLLYCFYFPAGNIEEQSAYIVGAAGSNCSHNLHSLEDLFLCDEQQFLNNSGNICYDFKYVCNMLYIFLIWQSISPYINVI